VRLRLELAAAEDCGVKEEPFYLTTETPERENTQQIVATRSKREATATKLKIGERVVVSLTSFTVLPFTEEKDTKSQTEG
jgi:hypothetical protein